MQSRSSAAHQSTAGNGVAIVRREVIVRGIVQGVGFRPFVHGLASCRQLNGFVRNQAGHVRIEVEGRADDVRAFVRELEWQPPPRARIDSVRVSTVQTQGSTAFLIEESRIDPQSQVLISADVATCDLCLAEMSDPQDRRFRYPFLNCTQCGPRLTVITAAPYDRHRTTMAGFEMCRDCRSEYHDPSSRRFHAQPTACPMCGPQLTIRQLPDTGTLEAEDPLTAACLALARGQIVAIKGLGGYHLATNAGDEAAVAELRRRKHRDDKPFAVMVADAAAARQLCIVSHHERELLESPRRPIVLLRRRNADIAPGVAPGHPWLGVMLPYTPLHHLLLEGVGRLPLVMTSGNQSDEPIAFTDDDALERLRPLADVMLTHDRPICIRCDDSVTRTMDGSESIIRRSRGDAPESIPLPLHARQPILAVGGQLKNTFALGVDQQAILSHHIGDLDYVEAIRAFRDGIEHYCRLFNVAPGVIAHDLHPDYASTHYAAERRTSAQAAHREPPRLLPVQHHHAHMVSCMAEHGLDRPCIGVIFDGTGCGPDGTVWGGEFLIGDDTDFRRAAHLRPVPLPGGEFAIREPWRMAFSHLVDSGQDGRFTLQTPQPSQLKTLRRMVERQISSPFTSSAGRLFDTVAVLAGLRETVRSEGQAAIELEHLAIDLQPDGVYDFDVQAGSKEGDPLVVDTRPLVADIVREIQRGTDVRLISRRFHTTVVEMITEVCLCLRRSTGIETVVLSGGVFQNSVLLSEVPRRLAAAGFRALRHQKVPTNDGGLSLGQLVIAAATLQREV